MLLEKKNQFAFSGVVRTIGVQADFAFCITFGAMTMATATTTYQVRLTEKEKNDTFGVFQELGMNPAQAVRLFFREVRQTKSIPFAIQVPNAETLKIFAESDAGIGHNRAKDAADLFKQLGI